MKIHTERGIINISPEVFAAMSGYAATNCFGVKGMVVRGVSDGIWHLLKPEAMSKGVKVRFTEGAVSIELHIAVEHGINIAAISKSIICEIRYVVERYTGVTVSSVDICVDSIIAG